MSASDRTCRDCGNAFRCDDAFFLERGLSLPKRCARCRSIRRLERTDGVIEFMSDRGFGFIAGSDGQRYYFDLFDFGSDGPAAYVAHRGQRVGFMPDRGRGKHLRARRIELLAPVIS